MACQKSYTEIKAHSLLVPPLQIVALNGVSPMNPPVHTTHSPMDLLSYVKIVKHTLQHAKYSGTGVSFLSYTLVKPDSWLSWILCLDNFST